MTFDLLQLRSVWTMVLVWLPLAGGAAACSGANFAAPSTDGDPFDGGNSAPSAEEDADAATDNEGDALVGNLPGDAGSDTSDAGAGSNLDGAPAGDSGEIERRADARTARDASTATLEGGLGTDGDTIDGANEASSDGCKQTTYFPDADADAFGRNSGAVTACDPPSSGTWATLGGDCNDDNPNVHPNQTAYYDSPYLAASGGMSFDYDCSGAEEGDPSQSGGAPNCPALALGQCSGQGFFGSGRAGAGINVICGSTTMRRCAVDLLECKAVAFNVEEAKRCR